MKIYRIELVNRGSLTIDVPAHQYILDAIEQAGLHLPVGCRYGVCITCAAKLIEGEIDQAEARCLQPKHLASGYVLLCVAYAKSDCRLEVGVECQTDLYVNPFQ